MARSSRLPVTIAFEGMSDEAIALRMCRTVGLDVAGVYSCNGKSRLDQRIGGYNAAAMHSPWLVLRDLDHDADCAAALRARLLLTPAPRMAFRIAVRAAEAWLMADRKGISKYLRVREGLLPDDPDAVDNPKRMLVDISRNSTSRDVRTDMVPEPGLSAQVGPGYVARIIEFARDHWDIDAAEATSDSLRRALAHLRRLR